MPSVVPAGEVDVMVRRKSSASSAAISSSIMVPLKQILRSVGPNVIEVGIVEGR